MPKMINEPIVFFPVESTVRELDYKINLARLLCNIGYGAIIGMPPFIRDELKYKNFQGGFLEKGGNPDPEYYQSLKAKGMLLYCLSDEGAAYPAYSVNYPPAIDALKAMDEIFLWGNFQQQDLIKRNDDVELSNKYRVTGYPGFEFSSPVYKEFHRALKSKDLPGSYILVNTNFGNYNGCDPDEVRKACPGMSPVTEQMLKDAIKKEAIFFSYFYKRLVSIINSFPEQKFLIRPHPTEKKENYIKYFEGCKNTLVSKDGTVNQLIADAKLVIHNDCTTALQAYLMKVPAISLAYPYKDEVYSKWALTFGVTPNSIEEINELIAYVLDNKAFPANVEASVNKSAQITLDEMFGSIGKSTEEVISVMHSGLKKKFANFTPYRIHDTRTLLQKFKAFVRKWLPLHYKVPTASKISLIKYTKADIQKRLGLLNKMDGLTVTYSIVKLFPNTYYIRRK